MEQSLRFFLFLSLACGALGLVVLFFMTVLYVKGDLGRVHRFFTHIPNTPMHNRLLLFCFASIASLFFFGGIDDWNSAVPLGGRLLPFVAAAFFVIVSFVFLGRGAGRPFSSRHKGPKAAVVYESPRDRAIRFGILLFVLIPMGILAVAIIMQEAR